MAINLKTYKNGLHNRSLGRAFGGIIIFIVVLTLVLVWIINSTFLEDFYVSDKTNTIKSVFNTLEGDAADKSLYENDYQERINELSSKENISYLVMMPDGTAIISSRRDSESILRRLFGVAFSRSDRQGGSLESNSKYEIQKYLDNNTGEEFLALLGALPDGNTVYIETPMESIRDSVGLTNRFLVIAGAVAIAVGLIIAFIMTRKILKPLRILTDISERMAHMDFDVKYTASKSPNEIDILGLRMNEMSRLIESNITQLKQANVELLRDNKRRQEDELMRREFISNISHELKTPISLIMGYADGLSDLAKSKEDRDYYSGVILDEAGKMDAMIRRLMELNEIEYGTDQIHLARVDLATVLREEVESIAPIAQKAEVKVITSDLDNPCYVWTDEFLARQVADNYLSNAIRYATGEKLVSVGILNSSEGEKAVLSVFNTCEGISEESGKRIWDKFYKIDPARTRQKGGSGIGLSIVKAAAESLKASYGYENKENGVEFYFSFETTSSSC